MDELRKKVISSLETIKQNMPKIISWQYDDQLQNIVVNIELAITLLKEQEVHNNDGWISVKDRPPEIYKEINIAEPGVFHDWLIASGCMREDGCFYIHGNIMANAKYWMPLPESSKEKP